MRKCMCFKQIFPTITQSLIKSPKQNKYAFIDLEKGILALLVHCVTYMFDGLHC